MRRGEIYYIRSTYREEGSEQRADRPAVIVSNDKCNEYSGVVEIVYLTTKPKKDLPTHVLTRSARVPSTILCEQIYSVSVERLDEWIGTLTEEELRAVDYALAISLGLDFAAEPQVVVREPTREELETLARELQPEDKAEPKTDTEGEVYLERIKTERALYKKFCEDMLEVLKKGARP